MLSDVTQLCLVWVFTTAHWAPRYCSAVYPNPCSSKPSRLQQFSSCCLCQSLPIDYLSSSAGRIISLFLVRFFTWLSRVRSIQAFCYSCYQCLWSLFLCLGWILDHISNLSHLQQQAYEISQNIISQFWMIVSYSVSWHMKKLPRNYHSVGRTN